MATDLHHARRHMVQTQLIRRGIEDARVLHAMGDVRRENFVAPDIRDRAYDDSALPIGEAQTISQPYIVALMLEAAEIQPGDKVLEVGVGSGYAAAVIGSIANNVIAVERHAALAESARRNLQAAGQDNVEVFVGDGTKGWPQAAPFDAIIVSAGGPDIPHALLEQLEIGGRLIIPVGDAGVQRLMRIVRLAAGRYEEEDLGKVAFVQLIGQHGWSEQDDTRPPGSEGRSAADAVASLAEPLPGVGSDDFAMHFDRFAGKRVVLLGEATHGTSEFYCARAAITRRLVEDHGFQIVAVEADWPDAAAINRALQGRSTLADEPPPFQRFPRWMWRNEEMKAFFAWLRHHNRSEGVRPASFYGLDIYNMAGAVAIVLAHLDEVDPEAAAIARERYGCLTPWQHDPGAYARMTLSVGYKNCETEVVQQCRDMLARQVAFEAADGASFLDASQSARLVAAAEEYYRTLYYGGAASWNVRDRHMFDTLRHVLDHHGRDAKAVVWAHNSHIADARETDMGRMRGELSLGQLCRQQFGDDVALVGFGTDRGTVAAAQDWGGAVQRMPLRASADDSWERLCRDASPSRALFDFGRHDVRAGPLDAPRQQRFVGVIYRPETEKQSHYLAGSIARQYDAYVWLDETEALQPTAMRATPSELPDTFPFGM